MIESRTIKVLALSLGQTLKAFVSIFFGMIAARLLTKHDFATLKQTMLAYNFVAPILMLGLPNALYFFLPKEKIRKKGVLIDNLLLLFILSIIFSIFLLVGGHELLSMRFNNPDLNSTLKWMIPYPIFVMPASILGAVLLTQNKTLTLTLYNILSSLAITLLATIAILITKSYTGPLLIQIYFPLLLLPIILWLCYKNVPGDFALPNRKSMIEMLKYSIPLGLASMLGMIMLETNKIVVSFMCTPEQFANYVNGAIEIPLIGVVTGSISTVILVDMTKYIHLNNKPEALKLFKKAALKSSAILFPVMIFLLTVGREFIVTLFSEKYLESVKPFYVFLFVLPIRIVLYGSALMALNKPKVILYRSAFDLLINTLLSIILIKLLGYLGAAIATILTLYLWTVPYNLYKIAQGFEVNSLDTLPFKKIGNIFFICIIFAPFSLLHLFLSISAPLKLILAAILYFPLVLYTLFKYNYIEIPNTILNFIYSLNYFRFK